MIIGSSFPVSTCIIFLVEVYVFIYLCIMADSLYVDNSCDESNTNNESDADDERSQKVYWIN